MLSREWFAGLAYAPLLERPEILTMIREWTQHRVAAEQLEPQAFADALERLVTSQLGAVLDGKVAPAWTTTDDAPYETPMLLGRLAVYTLNLILLWALAGEGESPERRIGKGDWLRLTSLWRSEWSLEALAALTSVLDVIEDEDDLRLTARKRIGVSPPTDPITRVWQTASALGDRHLRLLAGLQVYDLESEPVLEWEALDLDLAVRELGLELPVLLRDVRDRGWAAAVDGRIERFRHHVDEAIRAGAMSRAQSDLLALVDHADSPSTLRQVVSEASGLLEPETMVLGEHVHESFAMATAGAMAKSSHGLMALALAVYDEAGLLKLHDRPRLAGLLLRLLCRMPAVADRVALPCPAPTTHPEILAALLAYQHPQLQPEIGAAAHEMLIQGDVQDALPRLSAAGLRDVVAAADGSPHHSPLRQWLTGIDAEGSILSATPTDVLLDMVRVLIEDEGSKVGFEDPAALLAVAANPRVLAATTRLARIAPAPGWDGSWRASPDQPLEESVTLPSGAIGWLPLSAVAAAIDLDDRALGKRAARELEAYVTAIEAASRRQ
jgi:hypothetical protein